jgi:mono/diheme cytochrome c family protein
LTTETGTPRFGPDLRRALGLPLLVAALLGAAGCRQNMHDQHKLEPFEVSTFFADGQMARRIPQGTVPRGYLREGALYTGVEADGRTLLARAPMPVTVELLRRGQQRYDAFCAACHDRAGTGQGMIVRRGYKRPPSFHEPRLREMPIGHFFVTATQGFGVMPSYAEEISTEDRWAVAAYVRALQYSQNARLAELPPELRQVVEAQLAEQLAEPGPESDETP